MQSDWLYGINLTGKKYRMTTQKPHTEFFISVPVFLSFTEGFTRQKANHGLVFEQFKVFRYSFTRGIYKQCAY